MLDGAGCVARAQQCQCISEILLETWRWAGIWRNECVPYALDDLLGCRVGEHGLPDKIIHDAWGEHGSEILQVHEVENSPQLLGLISRPTLGIGLQVLEHDRTIGPVFVESSAGSIANCCGCHPSVAIVVFRAM